MRHRAFLRPGAFLALGAVILFGGVTRSVNAATPDAAGGVALLEPETASGEIAYLTAAEQIRRFKEGSLSPVDVLEAQIERIHRFNGPINTAVEEPANFMAFNGQINAIAFEHFDEARKAAKESERRYREGTARELEGITVAIKDENPVKDWRVTWGTLLMKDNPPCDEDGAIIDMLKNAGAVLHVQTTVPEFYMNVQTWSRLWGVTRNPWNLRYGVGGSSGGSGAALAAGFTTLATGSDMGGSIRIPSSQCGVYGFKPPFGRVPTSEISFETLGPMARTFSDLVMMQRVIAGPHPTVHSSLRPKLFYPLSYDTLKGVKIAVDYFESWQDEGTDEAVKNALSEAVETLRRQGAIVEEVKLGWRSADIYETFMRGLMASSMGAMLVGVDQYEDQLTSYVRHALESLTKVATGPADLEKSDILTTVMHRQLQEEVYGKGFKALIMPTMVTPYMTAEFDPGTDTTPVNGKPAKGIGICCTYPWNLLSRYPVVDVPIGIAPNKVPVGMQIIGNTFDDLAAFQVAHSYSQAGLKLYQNDAFPEKQDKR